MALGECTWSIHTREKGLSSQVVVSMNVHGRGRARFAWCASADTRWVRSVTQVGSQVGSQVWFAGRLRVVRQGVWRVGSVVGSQVGSRVGSVWCTKACGELVHW